ncbi:hypothetical protein FB451DRAFT_1177088 [Mycena latifolia]|nr:hypothetical protein FB451DRAFT_1177088 [Mycena latifolia]
MFDTADDLTPREIQAYRSFAFPSQVGEPGHEPYFSVDNAAHWMTSFGYQLYLEHVDDAIPTSTWDPGDAISNQLRAYRTYIISEEFWGFPFFDLENLEVWVNPVAFQAYMELPHRSMGYRDTPDESTPASSRAPSCAASSQQ